MIDQILRDPWRAAWQTVTSNYLIAALLLSTAAGLVITDWLPQMPVADQIAYAHWRSEAQVRFGDMLPTLESLGLFTITRSLGFHALLALLAGCLLLRLIEGSDRLRQNREIVESVGEWKPAEVNLPDVVKNLRHQRYRVLGEPPLFQADRWPWADLFPLLAHSGGLLLLIGLLVTHLWGWQVEGLIVQSDEKVTLPDTEIWVALDENARAVTHSPGIVTFVENRGPSVQARADDGTGRPLSLQQPAETNLVTQLTVPLDQDRYFAIPEVQLVVRLAPQPGNAVGAYRPVLAQVYRSPSGLLATETVVEGDTELVVGDVTVKLTSVSHARLIVVSNPGLWPTGIGLVLLIVGLLGSIVWPMRRLWLREEAERVEITGDLPPTLVRGREA
ncbi:MAG: cytochrome c biogenesis protein ResB [Chloroflexota bacterium]|nr:cytochrome c biogenesis protein ResB [Chloroflexota bacterium]